MYESIEKISMTLPIEIRELLLKNIRNNSINSINTKKKMYEGLSVVIMSSFTWESSPQGHEFWRKIYCDYLNLDQKSWNSKDVIEKLNSLRKDSDKFKRFTFFDCDKKEIVLSL